MAWRQQTGVLKDPTHLSEDPLVIQRNVQEEWG